MQINQIRFKTFDHSFRTLENTLDFAKINKTPTIYMSSSMVYGNFDSEDVNEERNCKPIGIYGTLKYSGELLVKAYSKVFDLRIQLRPSAFMEKDVLAEELDKFLLKMQYKI